MQIIVESCIKEVSLSGYSFCLFVCLFFRPFGTPLATGLVTLSGLISPRPRRRGRGWGDLVPKRVCRRPGRLEPYILHAIFTHNRGSKFYIKQIGGHNSTFFPKMGVKTAFSLKKACFSHKQ